MSEWERCEGFVERALKRSPCGQTTDDVRAAVESGEALFWPGKRSAVITELTRDFHVWLAGGDLQEICEMNASAEAYARGMGCERMTVWQARPGWERALHHLGYRRQTVLVKEL